MARLTEHRCETCKDQGWYFRVPPSFNPFAASIEVTAGVMRRVECSCEPGRAALKQEDAT